MGGVVRPRSRFIASINKCNEQFVYASGSYSEKSDEYIAIETIYGKGNVYHKNSFDPFQRIEANLPDDAKLKPFPGTMKVWAMFDLMKITCSIPLSLAIDFSGEDIPPQNIKTGDVFKTILAKDQTTTHDIESNPQMGIEAKVEKDSSLVDIYIDGKVKGQLNKNTKVFRAQLTNENNADNISVEFKSLSNSLISFQIGSQALYQEVIENDREITTNNQYILIKLKETDYYSVSITFTSEERISYCYNEAITESIIYIPLPKTNCLEFIGSDNIKFVNPYDKYISPDNKYYIAIAFKQTSQKTISIVYKSKKQAAYYVNEKEVIQLNKE